MLSTYAIGGVIGYFLIMLVFVVLGIIFAKRALGWILYVVGAVLQLISLLGMYRKYTYFYGTTGAQAMTTYWIVYALILVAGGIIIAIRRSRAD